MRKLVIALSLTVAAVVIAAATPPLLTRMVSVGTTATVITASAQRSTFLVQNEGPNPIYCQLGGDGGTVAVGQGIQVNAAGGSWGMVEREGWPIWCVASTAAQVDGGSTVITETR